MPVNFPSAVYVPNYAVWSRTINVIPIASQPGVLPYVARGIYTTEALNVMALDDTIISDQRTILDILEMEFPIMPAQRDYIEIPADGGMPDEGTFEIIDKSSNGGGETTLVLRKVVRTAP